MEQFNNKIEKKIKNTIIDENFYINNCCEYALSTGWIKSHQKDTLISRVFKPIYNKYAEIIREDEILMEGDDNKEEILDNLLKRLNAIMEITRRIGSTENQNIIRAIDSYISMSYQTDSYINEGLDSMKKIIFNILFSVFE